MKHWKRAILFLTFASAVPAQANAEETTWLTPDFFVTEYDSTREETLIKPRIKTSDCREHISKIVCVVDSETTGKEKCLPGSEKYIPVFQKLHDAYSPVFQKMFCSLGSIYIEKNSHGTAYGGVATDKATGEQSGIMGIRQSVLDEQVSLAQWSSWKEQLSFGGIKDSYTVSDALPQFSVENDSFDTFLFYVVAHEFGHIFDGVNDVNKVGRCKNHPTEATEASTKKKICYPGAKSWTRLSWLHAILEEKTKDGQTTFRSKMQILPDFEFALRKNLCFYGCEKNFISKSDANNLYWDMFYKSNFISTYASTGPYDDFAETVAYHAMAQKGNRIHLDTMQGTLFDVTNHLSRSQMSSKVEFINSFFARKNLVYP